MSVVWSGICAVAALAAAAQRVQGTGEGSQMRTKVLPGHGYIRYEVLPGDEETEPGELIVVHEERRPAPSPSPESVQAQSPAPAAGRSCVAAARASLRSPQASPAIRPPRRAARTARPAPARRSAPSARGSPSPPLARAPPPLPWGLAAPARARARTAARASLLLR